MKIIAIYPSTGLDMERASIGLPLPLLHAFSKVVKAGYDVQIIDQRLDKQWRKSLINELKNEEILFAGISSMTGGQLAGTVEAAKLVKKISKKTPVILGGIHATLLPAQTLTNRHIDIVVMGEGEITLLELTERLISNTKLEKLRGVAYKTDNGRVIMNEQREFMDINETADIPYDLVNVQDYYLNLYGSKKTLSLQAGRGCPHRCNYCYNTVYSKRKWRSISAEKMFSKIKLLKELGAESVDLVDDNYFTSIRRVEKFIQLMESEKIEMKFLANIRIDYLAKYSRSFLKKLKKTGFEELFIGVETGSETIAHYIKKDMKVNDAREVNIKLKECGIKPIYSFMAGFPGEKLEEINETVDLMVRLKRDNPISSLTSLKVFTPYPGTELYDICIKNGFKPPETLEEWSKFNYNYSGFSFRSKKLSQLTEKLSYMTYFLDNKSMIKHLGGNPFLNLLIRIYSFIALLRCKTHFYFFTPEIPVMKFYHQKILKK